MSAAASTSRLTISPPSPPSGASPSSPPSPSFFALGSPPVAQQLSTTSPQAQVGAGRPRSGSRTFEEAEEDARIGRRVGVREEAEQGLISAGELRAEVETLLSLRRRSLSTPIVDPDLPPTAVSPALPSPTHARPQLSITISPSPPLSPNNPQDALISPTAVSPTAPAAAETGTLVRRRSTAHHTKPSDHPLPQHQMNTEPSSVFSPVTPDSTVPTGQDLFWLPASLHPELAPQEFKAFIRDQTRPESLARRSSLSGSGAGLGRRKSTLRGEYKPSQGDGVGESISEEGPDGLRRAGSQSARGHTRLNFEELTIDDLQRLEMLAAHAEAEGGEGEGEGEGERLGRVLRRSLSLNPTVVAHAAAGARGSRSRSPSPSSAVLDPTSPTGDAPIIVPPPGQILRRSARTQIRKNGRDGTRYGPSARRNRQGTADSLDGQSFASDEADVGFAGGAGDSSYESNEIGGGMSPPTSSEDFHEKPERTVVDPYQHFDAVDHIPPTAVLQQEQVDLALAPRKIDNRVAAIYVPAPPPGASPAEGMLPSLTPISPIRFEHFDQAEDQLPPPMRVEEESYPPAVPPKEIPPTAEAHEWQVNPYAPQYSPEEEQTSQRYSSPAPLQAQSTVLPPPVIVPPPQRKDSFGAPRPGPSPSPTSSATPSPGPSPSGTPPPPPALGRSPSASSNSSSRPGSTKEKKSGWARLGLVVGSSKEKERDKGEKEREKKDRHLQKVAEKALQAEREREQRLAREKAAQEAAAANEARKLAQAHEKERERDKLREDYQPPPEKREERREGGGFLSGLFGKKREEKEKHREVEEIRPPPPFVPPQPPPTASGALLPDGSYTNFYRLPIHVERAVYRLSHIKLANPRRPLYEQVLISNLMFWYLGVINSATPANIPTAPPVPVPGMRKKEQEEREARESAQHEPGQGADLGPGEVEKRRPQVTRSAELARETKEETQSQRLSAPADLYAGSTTFSSEDEDELDDHSIARRASPSPTPRDEYPPPVGDEPTPIAIKTSPKPAKHAGFEVTSRRTSSGTAYGSSPYAPVAQQQSHLTVEGNPLTHRRLNSGASIQSNASDRSSVSFDEAGFLDAYGAPSPPEGAMPPAGLAISDTGGRTEEVLRVEEGEAILGGVGERRKGARVPVGEAYR